MTGNNEDYRLYYYTSGQLQKTSSSKVKDLRSRIAHMFTTYDRIVEHANWLKSTSKHPHQYVVVKYEGSYDSKIIEII